MDQPTCQVIGVLDNGLESLASAQRQQIAQAELIIGVERLLILCAPIIDSTTEQRALDGQLGALPGWINAATGKRVVVLASGDPLLHGVGNFLIKRLPVGSVTVFPNLSYLQIALTRLGLAGETAERVSVHKGDSGPWSVGAGPNHALYPLLRALLNDAPTIALLTSPANNPTRIAELLQMEGLAESFKISICEHLMQPTEQISPLLDPSLVATQSWADPNVVVLHRQSTPALNPLFGLPENTYLEHDGSGLVTRREVRAAALGQMALSRDSLVWDIGAGSGSIALEAARLCPKGWVWAVEKNSQSVRRIAANRRRLGALNLTVVHAKAPEGMETWPNPNAVFIGGSCGHLDPLIRLSLERLQPGGRLVLNFVTLENLSVAMTSLNSLGVSWVAVQIHAARSSTIKGMHRLEGAAPVWILTATKDQP